MQKLWNIKVIIKTAGKNMKDIIKEKLNKESLNRYGCPVDDLYYMRNNKETIEV